MKVAGGGGGGLWATLLLFEGGEEVRKCILC